MAQDDENRRMRDFSVCTSKTMERDVCMAQNIRVQHTEPRRFLQPASGYLQDYDYTLNPFVGCVFACKYCYVRAMPIARFHEGQWGSYVDVKQLNSASFTRELIAARKRGTVRIFMSSSTDPYQPIEYREQRSRTLLEQMVAHVDLIDFLFIQTRSPLVTRDIDLLQALAQRVMVSMTIETDLEDVRRRFTPYAPPLPKRYEALRTLRDNGILTQVAVSPVLPASDHFASSLRDLADYVVIDDYFMGDGASGKRTKQLHVEELYTPDEFEDWYQPHAYQKTLTQFQTIFPTEQVYVSRMGFLPPADRK